MRQVPIVMAAQEQTCPRSSGWFGDSNFIPSNQPEWGIVLARPLMPLAIAGLVTSLPQQKRHDETRRDSGKTRRKENVVLHFSFSPHTIQC